VVCGSDRRNIVLPNVTVIASTSSSGEASASNLGPEMRQRKRGKLGLLTSRLHRLPRGPCRLWQEVNLRHPQLEGVGFHILITGVFTADPDMFYDLSRNRCSQSTGCLGFGSQKIAISHIVEPRKKRRKNQQSRVERPITDWFVSWSCLGIRKDFISEAEGIQNSLRILWLQERALRKQMGRLRSS